MSPTNNAESTGNIGNVVHNPDIKVTMNKEGNRLLIDIPFEGKVHASRKGRTFMVASTHGLLATGLKYKGENEILLQVNAMIDLNL